MSTCPRMCCEAVFGNSALFRLRYVHRSEDAVHKIGHSGSQTEPRAVVQPARVHLHCSYLEPLLLGYKMSIFPVRLPCRSRCQGSRAVPVLFKSYLQRGSLSFKTDKRAVEMMFKNDRCRDLRNVCSSHRLGRASKLKAASSDAGRRCTAALAKFTMDRLSEVHNRRRHSSCSKWLCEQSRCPCCWQP